ncbi:MAG TPA: hypothetical protein VEA16_12985, partial [Vicinamibacterales bacterium]|nr:hypothetical protein [Vicinamibacterales bacterium]
FLQAIGKYLEYRAERGLVDAKYAYAQAVLLNYATWMCANERPYLDTPERLEYPTETWAAQDLRKAAVFEYAARHTSDEGTRARFLARADGFVDYAIAALTASPTGRRTRPLVLLLAYGFQRPMLDVPVAAATVTAAESTVAGWHPPDTSAGNSGHPPFRRESFTPLRQRLIKRLALAGAGVSAATLTAIALLIS